MRRRLALFVFVGLGTLISSAGAQPLRSSTQGFTFGGGLLGSSVSTTSNQATVTESGRGLQLELGWGFTPHLTVFLASSAAEIASDMDYTLGQGDLGMRYLFRATDKQARPYIEGAASGRQLRLQTLSGYRAVTAKASGASLTLGGGVQVFLSPKVAFDVGFTYTPGTFTDFTVNGVAYPYPEFDAASAQLRLGMRFWPVSR